MGVVGLLFGGQRVLGLLRRVAGPRSRGRVLLGLQGLSPCVVVCGACGFVISHFGCCVAGLCCCFPVVVCPFVGVLSVRFNVMFKT